MKILRWLDDNTLRRLNGWWLMAAAFTAGHMAISVRGVTQWDTLVEQCISMGALPPISYTTSGATNAVIIASATVFVVGFVWALGSLLVRLFTWVGRNRSGGTT